MGWNRAIKTSTCCWWLWSTGQWALLGLWIGTVTLLRFVGNGDEQDTSLQISTKIPECSCSFRLNYFLVLAFILAWFPCLWFTTEQGALSVWLSPTISLSLSPFFSLSRSSYFTICASTSEFSWPLLLSTLPHPLMVLGNFPLSYFKMPISLLVVPVTACTLTDDWLFLSVLEVTWHVTQWTHFTAS